MLSPQEVHIYNSALTPAKIDELGPAVRHDLASAHSQEQREGFFDQLLQHFKSSAPAAPPAAAQSHNTARGAAAGVIVSAGGRKTLPNSAVYEFEGRFPLNVTALEVAGKSMTGKCKFGRGKPQIALEKNGSFKR